MHNMFAGLLYKQYVCACNLITYNVCLKQKEEDTCLGTSLTVADAAYVFSSSQLSTPEEGSQTLMLQKSGVFLQSFLHFVIKACDCV